MNVLITGANGFIGAALARALLDGARIADDSGRSSAVHRLVLADRSAPQAPWSDARVRFVAGDLADPQFARTLLERDTACVFHLAGVVSGAAEADFSLGLAANLDGTRNMLEACRTAGTRPRFVFASSIAVYGTPLPEAVDDDTPALPTLSYGTQKLVCEHLIADYTRRGFVAGRSLRLPGIVVRPRLPNGALSGFNSDVIREPLAGREVVCPVSPQATIWILSLRQAIAALMRAASGAERDWEGRRGLLLPAVVVSIEEILAALERAARAAARKRVRFEPQEALERQFGRWPRKLEARRALALGFTCDAGIDAIVREHLAQTQDAPSGA